MHIPVLAKLINKVMLKLDLINTDLRKIYLDDFIYLTKCSPEWTRRILKETLLEDPGINFADFSKLLLDEYFKLKPPARDKIKIGFVNRAQPEFYYQSRYFVNYFAQLSEYEIYDITLSTNSAETNNASCTYAKLDYIKSDFPHFLCVADNQIKSFDFLDVIIRQDNVHINQRIEFSPKIKKIYYSHGLDYQQDSAFTMDGIGIYFDYVLNFRNMRQINKSSAISFSHHNSVQSNIRAHWTSANFDRIELLNSMLVQSVANHTSDHLMFIPFAYPKVERFAESVTGEEIQNQFILHSSSYADDQVSGLTEYKLLIPQLFNNYPQYQVIFRPRPIDQDKYLDLYAEFRTNSMFYVSRSPDYVQDYRQAKILIAGDYTSSSDVFSFGTCRPSIIRVKSSVSSVIEEIPIGFKTPDHKLFETIDYVINNYAAVCRRIRLARDKLFSRLSGSLAALSKDIPCILNGTIDGYSKANILNVSTKYYKQQVEDSMLRLLAANLSSAKYAERVREVYPDNILSYGLQWFSSFYLEYLKFGAYLPVLSDLYALRKYIDESGDSDMSPLVKSLMAIYINERGKDFLCALNKAHMQPIYPRVANVFNDYQSIVNSRLVEEYLSRNDIKYAKKYFVDLQYFLASYDGEWDNNEQELINWSLCNPYFYDQRLVLRKLARQEGLLRLVLFECYYSFDEQSEAYLQKYLVELISSEKISIHDFVELYMRYPFKPTLDSIEQYIPDAIY